jgi:bifunctional UDP-N-acetylglucosamine pyrophosphorylase/glucosamine-1-phosphate N-acetyltransferase
MQVFVSSDSTWLHRSLARDRMGAASCITEDVPEDSLAIGRGKPIIKEGWVKRKREAR